MTATTSTELDQITIGPNQLRSFIEILDALFDGVGDLEGDEIAHVATDLRIALGKWHKSIAFNTGRVSIDRLPCPNHNESLDSCDRVTLDEIDRHLSRLVSRHSNFGFGAVNAPSELDRFFPESAVTDVRTAHVRLRRILRQPFGQIPCQHLSHGTVTDRYMAVVLW